MTLGTAPEIKEGEVLAPFIADAYVMALLCLGHTSVLDFFNQVGCSWIAEVFCQSAVHFRNTLHNRTKKDESARDKLLSNDPKIKHS